MAGKRRSFTTEYTVEAAHRVIDSGRTIAEVGRGLGIGQQLLGKWVSDERRRIGAAVAAGETPLTPAERGELIRLRRQVAEQDKDLAFLKKASAYFAANQHNFLIDHLQNPSRGIGNLRLAGGGEEAVPDLILIAQRSVRPDRCIERAKPISDHTGTGSTVSTLLVKCPMVGSPSLTHR